MHLTPLRQGQGSVVGADQGTVDRVATLRRAQGSVVGLDQGSVVGADQRSVDRVATLVERLRLDHLVRYRHRQQDQRHQIDCRNQPHIPGLAT